MSLKNKLNRLKPHLSLPENSVKVQEPAPASIDVPFRDQWKQENVNPYFFDGDYCLTREVKYPLSHRHGIYQFADLQFAIDVWNQKPLNHPLSSSGHRTEELFFFDTETTGLGGGVGNTIFLLGYASVLGEELIVRQHILPHPGAEVALYQSFLEKVDYKTLVTYNGKSFDWPQVKTRHTLVREHVPKLPAFGHFDLYHAARRLWKQRLERMKLSVVEKEILGFERVDDIPGFLAPMIYFDFLESKRPDGMIGILKHNEMDILSLVTLYTHLTFQIHGIDHNQTRPESYEVGRWFQVLGENEEAKKVLGNLVEGEDLIAEQAKIKLAFQYKKALQWEEAAQLFIEAVQSSHDAIKFEAFFELAKLYEHKLKDYQQAIYYTESALKSLATAKELPNRLAHFSTEQFQYRLNRLKRKSVTKSSQLS